MSLFRRRPRDPELDAELRYHLDQLVAQYEREGLSTEEARRQASLDFGGVEPTKEALRDGRWLEAFRRAARDLCYGARQLAAAPGFTAVAVLSLALGIGANTALFSILNTALLRLIPVERPNELYWFRVDTSDGGGYRLNYPFFASLAHDARFGQVFCAYSTNASVSNERLEVDLVSGNYFDVLGVRPWRGRLLRPDDDRVRLGHPVVVVTHAYWRERLHEDPAAVGRSLRINGGLYTIIGVTPPGFAGTEAAFPRQMFVPLHMKPAITPGWDGLDKPLVSWLPILTRLPPGTDPRALSHELHARYHAFQKPHLDADQKLVLAQKEYFRHWRVRLEPLREAVLAEDVQRHLRTLVWVVLALLLLACANLAGLLLARGQDRQREIATRLAVGASRARIVTQLLMESLLLGLLGGAAGLLFGAWCAPAIAAWFPLAGEGSRLDVKLDPLVFAFTLTVSLLACVVFGLWPALVSTRLDLVAAIKGVGGWRAGGRQRQWLLAAQVAIAVVLLAVAGRFAQRLQTLIHTDVGFTRERLLIAEIEPVLLNYDGPARIALYQKLEAKLRERVGREFVAATVSNVSPISRFNWSTLFYVNGEPRGVIPRANQVGLDYLPTLGIRLKRGRWFDERDRAGSPRVAVISETTAREAFPNGDALGQRFMADPRSPGTFEIVGIVSDVELNDPRRPEREMVYFAYPQWPFPAQDIAIQVRVATPAAAPAALAAVRGIVAGLDPNLPLFNVRTIEQALDTLLAAERLAALLGGFFAFAAALLSAIGLYGMLARDVSARRKEIGVKLALGATARWILWPLLRESLGFTLAGLGAGVAVLAAAGFWDSRMIPAAITLMLATTALAASLPGFRATRVDPAAALRGD
ncbi:MAG: ADOP family duplicated permease [Bryobacteraceae bacterium]|nr:ADOP family duplicated permease [Bryobacteraceae bacterium]